MEKINNMLRLLEEACVNRKMIAIQFDYGNYCSFDFYCYLDEIQELNNGIIIRSGNFEMDISNIESVIMYDNTYTFNFDSTNIQIIIL